MKGYKELQEQMPPVYTGWPLSSFHRLVYNEKSFWTWVPRHRLMVLEPADALELSQQGYTEVSRLDEIDGKHAYLPTIPGFLATVVTTSRFCDLLWIMCDGQAGIWAKVSELEPAQQCPVILAFALDNDAALKDDHVSMLQFLPPPTIGQYAIVDDGKDGRLYHIEQLPKTSVTLWQKMKKALNDLASPSDWYTYTALHEMCLDTERYERFYTLVEQGRTIVGGEPITKNKAKFLHDAREQVIDLQQALNKADWLKRWEEIIQMGHRLSKEYQAFDQEATKKDRLVHLPPLTSNQRTPLPSSNGMRGLAQSFGPAIQPGLWNNETSSELTMKTPNNALLRVMGKNEHERVALYNYVKDELGVEGLKHMVGVLHAYYQHTGARVRKDDAVVTPYGLLKMLGYSDEEAGRVDVQRKFMNTILYLSRTWIQTTELEYETPEKRGPGRKRRKLVEYSPLIVLEAMKASEEGGLRIPETIEFHLGKEFYDLLFGDRKRYFTLPTAQMLSYHAHDEQQEICLAFHLTNYITLGGGSYAVHFPVLVETCAIRSQDDMQHGVNRTRDALRIIYALEHLQRDGWYTRAHHEDIDIALAVEYYLKRCKQGDLATDTYKRITGKYGYLQAKQETELRTMRRQALQHLLNTNNSVTEGQSHTISFKAGALLQKQAEKVEKGRKDAQDRRERAIIARALKNPQKSKAKKVVNPDEKPK